MMKFCKAVLVLVAMISGVRGQVSRLHKEKYLREYQETWFPHYLPNGTTVGWDTPCGKAMEEFNDALTTPQLSWAVNMIDSWGKSNDGFLIGTSFILGAYNQCLRTASPTNSIRGKYCSIFKPMGSGNSYSIFNKSPVERIGDRLHWINQNGQPLPQAIQWRGENMDPLLNAVPHDLYQQGRRSSGRDGLLTGNSLEAHQINDSVRMGGIPVFHPFKFITYGTCMPHVCSIQDLQESFNDNFDNAPWVINCDEPDWDMSLDAVDISFISFLSVIAVIMLAGTVASTYILFTKQEHLNKGPLKFLLPFSVSLNLKKIFAINPKPAPGVITCLNGMRVMSMCWVIYGHQNLFTGAAEANSLHRPSTDKWLFQVVMNATVCVDSFFFMSGLLLCYSVMKEMKRTGSLNLVMYYVHRIIRLTPPIAITVWYMSTLNRFTVRGPIPFSFGTKPSQLADTCRKRGWMDMTYTGNIEFENNKDIEGGCLGQCWYTAADTQLYALAPIVLLPMYYYKTAGRALMYVATLAAIGMRGFITWNMRNKEDGGNAWLYDNYLTTWTRADSWLIGIWTGYLIASMGQKKLVFKKWQVVAGWTLAVVFGLLVMFGRYHSTYQGAAHIMYEMTHRTVWASCLAWLTVACHYGYGGVVNEFLSHPSWQPFSRLTYGMYLVSMQFSFDLTTANRTLFYFTDINKIIETCAILFFSCIFAVFVSLTVESPVLGLEKLLFKRPGRGVQETVDNKTNPTPGPKEQLDAPSVPVGDKNLPPGYMRHAETVEVSGIGSPARGHDNLAFDPSGQDGIQLTSLAGQHSGAVSVQVEDPQPSTSKQQVTVEVEQNKVDPSS